MLDSLSSDFKPIVMTVLARLVEKGIAVMIVQTSRTLAEHEQNLQDGTSSTPLSKHLPRSLRGIVTGTDNDSKADAIDLCPYQTFQITGGNKLNWAEDDTPEAKAAWAAIMDIGELYGLRSGARWKIPHDPGHLEWLFPNERHPDIPMTSAAYTDHGVHA